jgi:catechol 2,3-dioxygenase-like lactoylglutathione lyase family enzyme
MTIEINGMAHVILTVSRFDLARDFYRKLLPQFGMKPVFDGDKNSFTASAAGRRSASNPATRRWLPSASSSSASASTTSACEPVRARTWIGARWCSRR